jgi:hypothetical protein
MEKSYFYLRLSHMSNVPVPTTTCQPRILLYPYETNLGHCPKVQNIKTGSSCFMHSHTEKTYILLAQVGDRLSYPYVRLRQDITF